MSLLWPDDDSERARHQLRDSVYRLREALGEDVIVSVGDELRLDAALIRCDVWDLEDAIRDGNLALAPRLYAGPFLDGFYAGESADFEHWVDAERRRLAALHVDAVEKLAAERGSAGDWSDAARLLQRLVDGDPVNARLVVKLMKALDAGGDRAAALRLAGWHAGRLRAEFDAGPDAQVEALTARLRRPAVLPAVESEVTRKAGVTAPVDDPLPPRTLPRARSRSAKFASAGVAGVALLGSAWWYTARSATALDPGIVAVVPFRVTAPDTSFNYLSEGIVDLAGVLLSGDGTPRAIDARTMLAAFEQYRGAAGTEPSLADCLAIASRLGAAQLVVGELVVTTSGTSLNARLLDVATGHLEAEHAETGVADVRLSTRLIAGLFAKHHGEGVGRLSGLSDSVEAVREYLKGMQTFRGSQPWLSFGHFNRAMQIDPYFATAALWRAFLAGEEYIFGDPERLRIDSVAWTLRGKLSLRDSLVLVTLPSIGPRYPLPSTSLEKIRAAERAVQGNPDRIEVLDGLAAMYLQFGSQAGIEAHIERAIAVTDRALALDSGFLAGLSLRTYLALLQGDTTDIRSFSRRFFAGLNDTTLAVHWRWAAARALGDSSQLQQLLTRVAERRGFAWQNLELWAGRYGLATIEDAARVAHLRLRAVGSGPDDRSAARRSQFRIATIRGQAGLAGALADSLEHDESGAALARPADAESWEDPIRHAYITLGMAGPGYDRQAATAARESEVAAAAAHDPAVAARDLCYAALWRANQGDTSRTRSTIVQIRRLAGRTAPGPGWRVTSIDVCPLLLDAALEWRDPPLATTQALDRVEALLLEGPQAEVPGNLGRLLVARWRERQGRPRDALAILRGVDPMAWTITGPAVWLAEGRVALLAGDTTAAIHAWSNYLRLRDRPDPGPIADEVTEIRQRLAALVTDHRR